MGIALIVGFGMGVAAGCKYMSRHNQKLQSKGSRASMTSKV